MLVYEFSHEEKSVCVNLLACVAHDRFPTHIEVIQMRKNIIPLLDQLLEAIKIAVFKIDYQDIYTLVYSDALVVAGREFVESDTVSSFLFLLTWLSSGPLGGPLWRVSDMVPIQLVIHGIDRVQTWGRRLPGL